MAFTPSRRQFLASTLGTLGLLGMGGAARLSVANTLADRYFVFVYFPGGWDVLMSLDPKGEASYTADMLADGGIDRSIDRSDDIDDGLLMADHGINFGLADFGGSQVTTALHPLLQRFGPNGTNALEDVGMSVVRGMTMDTLTHQVGRRRFLTGQPPSGQSARGSSMSTVMASLMTQGEPVPHLTSGVETYNVDQPQWATALSASNVDDLLKALRPGGIAIAGDERDRVTALLTEFKDCIVAQRSPTTGRAVDARSSATGLVSSGLDAQFDLFANRPDMQLLRERFQVASNGRNSPEARAALAAQAIATQTSRVATYTATAGLDTHFDNWAENQFANQYVGWRGIAALVDHLSSVLNPRSGRPMMEHTTLIAFSEFSRTPLINGTEGRDHWLMNSAMMLGKGIQTGIVGRSSDDGMAPVAVPVDGIEEYIKPEHLHQAMLHDICMPPDTVDLRVAPLLDVLSSPS